MTHTIVYFRKSTNASKKYMVTIYDQTNKPKTIHFGAAGYEDYTTHKDKERMKRYEKRHITNEKWGKSGIKTAGFWSKWILWNKTSISASITDTKKRFNIIIRKSAPPS